MKLIKAKFPGQCCTCGGRFSRGASIAYGGKDNVHHAACNSAARAVPVAEFADDDDDPDSMAAVLASDRRLASRGLNVIRFSSGAVMTQNSRGRCEDAPCCGCCS